MFFFICEMEGEAMRWPKIPILQFPIFLSSFATNLDR